MRRFMIAVLLSSALPFTAFAAAENAVENVEVKTDVKTEVKEEPAKSGVTVQTAPVTTGSASGQSDKEKAIQRDNAIRRKLTDAEKEKIRNEAAAKRAANDKAKEKRFQEDINKIRKQSEADASAKEPAAPASKAATVPSADKKESLLDKLTD